MAHRQEEAENHWPGFVDALSTIVMVVTFLLIILGVVIFIIAQQIKTVAGTSSQETEHKQTYFETDQLRINAELTQQKIVQAQSDASQAEIVKNLAMTAQAHVEQAQAKLEAKAQQAKMQQAKAETAKSEAAQAKASAEQAKAQAEQAKATAKAEASKLKIAQLRVQEIDADAQHKLIGILQVQLAELLRQNQNISTRTKGIRVVAQETIPEKQIAIATDEPTNDYKSNIVHNAKAILTLIFDGKSVKIDPASTDEIETFLSQQDIINHPSKLEIRAFVHVGATSIGERKRLAFYRAMNARNELLKLNIDPTNISIKVKQVDDIKLSRTLKIYVK